MKEQPFNKLPKGFIPKNSSGECGLFLEPPERRIQKSKLTRYFVSSKDGSQLTKNECHFFLKPRSIRGIIHRIKLWIESTDRRMREDWK